MLFHSPNQRTNFARTVALLLGILFLLISLSCSDGRPEIAEARAQFQALFPEAEVTQVRITEDEVVARSFTFRYRKRNSSIEKEIGIQFMQNNSTRRWEPMPAPPKELP